MNIKLLYTILFITLNASAIAANKDSISTIKEDIDFCSIEESAIINIIDSAKNCIGIPYKYGGYSTNGFDCSGFIGYIFNSYSGKLPRTSREMSKIGVKINRPEIQKGDFIFFKGRNTSSSSIGHVALVTDVDQGQIKIVHSTNRGVVEDILSEIKYYNSRYLFAIRLDYADYLNLF